MSKLHERLAAYPADALGGIRRGIEKEGLRVLSTGGLALTPHPLALGSALTHPLITTDYSESQLELITGAHKGVQQCLDELTEVHQFVHHTLKDSGGELLWAANEQHLAYLESYIAASLRERPEAVISPMGRRWVGKGLSWQLPDWMKSAKHREEVVAVLAKLRATLPASEGSSR